MTSRSSVLDDVGDINAPLGSRPWAVAVAGRIRMAVSKYESSAKHAGEMIKIAKENEVWKPLGLIDFGVLCLDRWGIDQDLAEKLMSAKAGETVRTVMDRAEGAEPLAGHGGDHKSPEVKDQVRNTNLKSSSQTAEYLTRRIARDHPTILERMKSGEFPSVRQAALEAGIVKPSFQCPIDVDRAARLILKWFSREDVPRLIELLHNG